MWKAHLEAAKRQIDSLNRDLRGTDYRVEMALNQLWAAVNWLGGRPHTTASPTPTAPTQDNPSVVEFCRECQAPAAGIHYTWCVNHPARTIPTTLPSLQSDPAEAPSGLVGRDSECVHVWEFNKLELSEHNKNYFDWDLMGRCMKCRAYQQFVLTPAQPAEPTSSTSVKQPSRPWDSGLSRESEPSPSRRWKLKKHVAYDGTVDYGMTDGYHDIMFKHVDGIPADPDFALHIAEKHVAVVNDEEVK